MTRCSKESIPDAASCSPIQALFVSTIWPSNNSVPIARTSHRILPAPAAPPRAAQAPFAARRATRLPTLTPAGNLAPPRMKAPEVFASGVLALPVDVAAAHDLQARHDRERDRDGEYDLLEAEVVGGERQQDESDRAVLRERLVLSEPLGGQHDAAPAR